ncbi:hypothetical protein F5148DRAFT_1250575 [Russula earlei]|uniref:Uncharacterized protein n=1 Tax=Russula earlei TaxID=71964 RepID=A0ACC0TV97_9AGAM|nr:hypothetical protein F5148DRAFT_1250575 [Russula earlei]
MNTNEGDSLPHVMFNHWFDALFGEDCCDPGGHLHHIHQGKLGMGIIISYLSKINWANNFSLDLVELKLQHLVDELKHLQLLIPPQSSRTLPKLRPLSFPSSTKLFRHFTHDKPTRMTLLLHLQHWMLIHMHCPQSAWGCLPKTSIATCPSMTVTVKMKLLTSQFHPKRSVQLQLHHRQRRKVQHWAIHK